VWQSPHIVGATSGVVVAYHGGQVVLGRKRLAVAFKYYLEHDDVQDQGIHHEDERLQVHSSSAPKTYIFPHHV
jgi:hypothetical protein